MSGIENELKRGWNFGIGKGYKTNAELRQKKKDKVTARKNKVYQDAELPDPEEIRRVERRKAAARTSARADTILTDRETLG